MFSFALATSAKNDDHVSTRIMPLQVTDTLSKDPTHSMALQSASGGGHLQRVGEDLRLVLKEADNMTAVIRDPLSVHMGIDMVPHAAMKSALPRFAVVLVNMTDTQDTTPDTFQVMAIELKELVQISPHGQLTYRIDVIDADLGRGAQAGDGQLAAQVESVAYPEMNIDNLASEVTALTEVDILQQELGMAPKRGAPDAFQQASVLIDLVDAADAGHRHESIRHMAETGELTHNINKFLANSGDVKPQGVLTIGWMLPWSLWAWICCPTFFILTPYLIPLWVFCCI